MSLSYVDGIAPLEVSDLLWIATCPTASMFPKRYCCRGADLENASKLGSESENLRKGERALAVEGMENSILTLSGEKNL